MVGRPSLGALRRFRGGGELEEPSLFAGIARAIESNADGHSGYAQDSGAAFVRAPAEAMRPYVSVHLSGAPLDREALLRDLQLTSLFILVGAVFHYKIIWRAQKGLKPQLTRVLVMLLVANALRVLIVNIFVPMTAAARLAFHADSDWWYSKGGSVLQTATEGVAGLDVGRVARRMFMAWFFTQGIADLVNEAPAAIRDVYVAATR